MSFFEGPSNDPELIELTRRRPAAIQAAMLQLLRAGRWSGYIRSDLDPFDLLRALAGVANVAASPDWEASAKRLIDILLLGSKPVG